MAEMAEMAQAFREALLAMDRHSAESLLREASARDGLLRSVEALVVVALESIGRDWEAGDLALSQVYMSGRLCESLTDSAGIPAPPLRPNAPRIGLGAFEDHHMLGKRLVGLALRAAGYPVVDYGRLDTDSVLRQVVSDKIEILCLSVLMLHSALHLRDLREALERAKVNVRLVVGGAPFRLDESLCERVGADAFGRSAADAVTIISAMTGGAR